MAHDRDKLSARRRVQPLPAGGALPQGAAAAAPPLRRVAKPAAGAVAAGELWAGLHLQDCGSSLAPEALASGMLRFTPRVSLVPPDGLLLEVKGSLHLHAGLRGLDSELDAECRRRQLRAVVAFAPTPLAALVLARAGLRLAITDAGQLVGRLAPLPLDVLRWPQPVQERLARLGVRTLGETLRLPRAGFARRFGAAQLRMLDRLVGRAPDVRVSFRAREVFHRRQDLEGELTDHGRLLAALAPLFVELGAFLTARQCGVLAVECLLWHRQQPPTRCELALAAPCADGARLQALFAERLDALPLPAAVRACTLRAPALLPHRPDTQGLWQPGEHGGEAGTAGSELIERLRVRLGSDAVHGLAQCDGHRPESAWALIGPPASPAAPHAGDAPAPWCAPRRPLWILPAPQPLEVRAGLPCRLGPLRLAGEGERIETGWWDGQEIGRDYYSAVDVHGVRLWVFRERAAPHGWFLHGVFG